MEKTWIVVANNSRARIFQLGDPRGALQEIEDLANPLGRADNKQLASDGNGRFGGPDGQSHTAPGQEEPVAHEVRLFARSVGERLELARSANRYQHLCLIAAPKFLGLLRENIHGSTRKLVQAELARNIASFSVQDIEECVAALGLRRALA